MNVLFLSKVICSALLHLIIIVFSKGLINFDTCLMWRHSPVTVWLKLVTAYLLA